MPDVLKLERLSLLLSVGVLAAGFLAGCATTVSPAAPPTYDWPEDELPEVAHEGRVTHYEIAGRNHDELLSSLAELGPETDRVDYEAVAKFSAGLTFSWKCVERGGGFAVELGRVLVQSETLLPRWKDGRSAAEPSLKRWWRYLLAQLTEHEKAHERIYLDETMRFAETLVQFSPEAGCRDLEVKLDSAMDRLKERLRHRNKEFDASEDIRLSPVYRSGVVPRAP